MRERVGKASVTPRAQPCCWTRPAALLRTRHLAEGQHWRLLPTGLGKEEEEPSVGHSPASQSARGMDWKGSHKAALGLGWPGSGSSPQHSPNPAGSSPVLPHGSTSGSTGILVFPAGATSRRSPLVSGCEHQLVFHVFFPSRKSVLIICF